MTTTLNISPSRLHPLSPKKQILPRNFFDISAWDSSPQLNCLDSSYDYLEDTDMDSDNQIQVSFSWV